MPTSPRKKKPPLFPQHHQWQVCYESWLASLRSESTRKDYGNITRSFFLFVQQKYGKPRTPEQIRRVDIEEFLRLPSRRGRHVGQPLSAWSHNTYQNALHAFFVYCSTYEVEFRGKLRPILRGHLPTAGIRAQIVSDANRDMEDDEVRRLFDAIDKTTLMGKRDYALFWTLLLTGRRLKEILFLRRCDMEYKHAAKKWIYWYVPKWRSQREPAEMPAEALEAIIDFHQSAGRDFETMDPQQPLFPGVAGQPSGRPMCRASADRRFRLYARLGNVPENVVIHSLRHEHAWSRYQLNGNDVLEVRNALGHSSVDTTLKYIERRKKKQRGDQYAPLIAARFTTRV